MSLIHSNIYPPAWDAVKENDLFPWHRYAHLPHSSQALAVDVFGTLVSLDQERRNAALSILASFLGVSGKGPWSVELEWLDEENRLNEKRRTQVDVLLRGRETVVCVECKFTESAGGACSQAQPLSRGRHKGGVQCNGNYEPQTNPVNSVSARCSLTGKGIRYWDFIPDVFSYSAEEEYRPCPFAGAAFQWMRNMVLSRVMTKDEGLRPAFVLMYADCPTLHMPQYLAGQGWRGFTSTLRDEAIFADALTYQAFIGMADKALVEAGLESEDWSGLRGWVDEKIDKVGKDA